MQLTAVLIEALKNWQEATALYLEEFPLVTH